MYGEWVERTFNYVTFSLIIVSFTIPAVVQLVFFRRHAEILMKALGKIRMAAKADLIGDFSDGSGVLLEQQGSVLQANGVNKMGGRFVGQSADSAMELNAAHAHLARQVFHREGIIVKMFFNDCHRFFQKGLFDGNDVNIRKLQKSLEDFVCSAMAIILKELEQVLGMAPHRLQVVSGLIIICPREHFVDAF